MKASDSVVILVGEDAYVAASPIDAAHRVRSMAATLLGRVGTKVTAALA